MTALFLANLEERTLTLTSIEQVAEQSGISQEEFEKQYDGDPLKVNEDLHGFEYTYDANYFKG